MEGAGTLGSVTVRSPSIQLRINGNASDANTDFDLNGTSQRIAGMGGNGGKLVNNKPGTTSTLTLGFLPGHVDTTTASWGGAYKDNNNGDGGIVAITKTGSNTQVLSGNLHSYSGPTTISEGKIEFTSSGAPSPNSSIKLSGTGGLSLLFTGVRGVPSLSINGVPQPAGYYNAASNPAQISGAGTLYVLGALPASDIYSYSADATVSSSTFFRPFGDVQIDSPAILNLTFNGTSTVNGLFLSGVRQPSGVYGAIGSGAEFETASITGGGTLTVTNAQASIPATLAITGPATSPVLTWTSVGVLQSSSDLSTWTNLPAARSPFSVTPIADAKLYYRIKQ
jgi:autotransporter-associated beta strand protein